MTKQPGGSYLSNSVHICGHNIWLAKAHQRTGGEDYATAKDLNGRGKTHQQQYRVIRYQGNCKAEEEQRKRKGKLLHLEFSL